MTNRKNQNGRSSNRKAQDFGVDFVNIPLDKAQKAELVAQQWTGEDLSNALNRLAEAGVKVSFSYVEKNDSVICNITSQADPETGRKTSVSSFGPDASEACKVAWYKWAVLTDGGQWHLYQVEDELSAYG